MLAALCFRGEGISLHNIRFNRGNSATQLIEYSPALWTIEDLRRLVDEDYGSVRMLPRLK
jgi:hypothetical protein